MGMYGYICRQCRKNIRGGEIAHLIHVRHGEIIGECVGHYNGYGGVDEDPIFDHWSEEADSSPNRHDEVMASKFDLPDSVEKTKDAIPRKLLDGRPTSFNDVMLKIYGTRTYFEISRKNLSALRDEYEALPDNLTPVSDVIASGVVAYHEKCYCIANKRGKIVLQPSEIDPDQSCGKPRKKFVD